MTYAAGGQVSDNLVLERQIGSGGMGSVWVAKNTSLGNRVAVKLLHRTAGLGAAETRARFEAEARGLAQLDHPNIVRVFDFGMTADGDPYIVMELLRGVDLATRLKSGPMDLETTSRILRQMCRALSRAHDAGVVHRDIKPANVFLVDADDGEVLVKLLDFGVARFANAGMDSQTRTNALVGTPFYMSPEQHMSPKGIDHRADLWSVAVVAYVCLTGRLPFEGETVTSLGLAILHGERPALRTLRADLPIALDIWMDRALSRDPAARYQSASELAESFDRARAASVKHSPGAPASAALPASGAASIGSGPQMASIPSGALGASAPGAPMGAASAPGAPMGASVPGAQPSASAPMSAHALAPQMGAPATISAVHAQPYARKSALPIVIAGIAAVAAAGGIGAFFALRGGESSATTASAKPSAMAAKSAAVTTAPANATTAPASATTATSTASAAPAPSIEESAVPVASASATPEPASSPIASLPGTASSPKPTPSASSTATSTPSTAKSTEPPKPSTRGSGQASGALSSCWRDSVDPPHAGSSASVSFFVDESGHPSAIKVSGPASAIKGYNPCVVTRISGRGWGEGPAETISASATLPAL